MSLLVDYKASSPSTIAVSIFCHCASQPGIMLSQLVFFASVASAAFPSNPQFSVDPNNAPIFDDGEPNICRDGGGSGTLNGFKAIAFSDTYKNNADGSSQFFQANSFTYYGFVCNSSCPSDEELTKSEQPGGSSEPKRAGRQWSLRSRSLPDS